MQVENWPINRPKPYPKNARKWSALAVEKVAASIREYGWRQPIVVDAEDVIVIGHLRLAAAKSLRLTEVPVHVARDLTPAQVRGLRLADLVDEIPWDLSLFAPEIADPRALAFDLSKTGFDGRELDSLLRDPTAGRPTGSTAAGIAVTLPDVFGSGAASRLCADATSPEAVPAAGERKPVPDDHNPPYGIELDSNGATGGTQRLQTSRGQLHEAPDRGPH
jgi:site-specific DNA-methyltransferase (adenine-specific)